MISARRRRLAVVAKLQAFIAANHDRPLYLAEICAATGATERMLRLCCQEHLGVSPIRYLWLQRMRMAHQALREATPETATVTVVATAHGFFELGRFASEYRDLFGETPVTTLRRPPPVSVRNVLARA